MKTKSLILGILACICSVMATACSSDDNLAVNEAVITAFQQKYPNTTAKWGFENNLYKAEFVKNGAEVDAWFQADGTWVKSETDLQVSDLPANLKEIITRDYAQYVIDDVDWIETPNGNYYEVELEKAGAADLYIYITAKGQYVNQ